MYKRKLFFGKHKGEFILDVIENDTQYITWMNKYVDWLKLNDYEMATYEKKLKSINNDVIRMNVGHRNRFEEEIYQEMQRKGTK